LFPDQSFQDRPLPPFFGPELFIFDGFLSFLDFLWFLLDLGQGMKIPEAVA